MPRRALTDRFCGSARVSEGALQTDYFDEHSVGLALRVSAGGTRSWTFIFTWAGKRARASFGAYPAVSLARARTLAQEARTALAEGRDPRSALARSETLRAVCDEWATLADGRTVARRASDLSRLVYPSLGSRPIAEIRRSEIIRLLDGIAAEQGPAMADKTLSILSRVFNFHAARSDDFRSPIVRGMSRLSPKSRARSRILTDDEIRIIWRTAGDSPFCSLVRFLLLTSARRAEAARMTWSELAGADWMLPAARNKTGLELLRTLPKSALAVLPPRGAGPFVFSTNEGHVALRNFGKFKAAFDARIAAEGQSIPHWTLHDLRRSARSLMSRAGVAPDHAERVLGHVIGGVRGTYDLWEYRDEKAAALAALARLVAHIIAGKPTVVTLRRREPEANG